MTPSDHSNHRYHLTLSGYRRCFQIERAATKRAAGRPATRSDLVPRVGKTVGRAKKEGVSKLAAELATDGSALDPKELRVLCAAVGIHNRPPQTEPDVIAAAARVQPIHVDIALENMRKRGLVTLRHDRGRITQATPTDSGEEIVSRVGDRMPIETLKVEYLDVLPRALRIDAACKLASLMHEGPERAWTIKDLAFEGDLSRRQAQRVFETMVQHGFAEIKAVDGIEQLALTNLGTELGANLRELRYLAGESHELAFYR